MTDKTFKAPSGTEFIYQVDDDGKFSKNDLITWIDDGGLAQYVRGADLVALAIHWIEGEILELVADDKVPTTTCDPLGVICRYCGCWLHRVDNPGRWRAMDSNGFDLEGGGMCSENNFHAHEPRIGE